MKTEKARVTRERICDWIVDSGCSSHMTSDKKLFSKLEERTMEKSVVIADGNTMNVEGYGEVRGFMKLKTGSIVAITLKDVLYVPKLDRNLFSVEKASQQGHAIILGPNRRELILKEGNSTLLTKNHGSYYLKFRYRPKEIERALYTSDEKKIWHRRLAHISDSLSRNLRTTVTGIPGDCIPDGSTTCGTCLSTKSAKKGRPKNTKRRANQFLGRVHMDVNGPFSTPGKEGEKYLLNIVDDHSRMAHLYALKRKSEVIDKQLEYPE